MTTWITVCDTCKQADWADRSVERTDGEVFAERIEHHAQAVSGLRVRRHSCLMGCANACNVTIQATGKLSYTMGKFDGTEPDAEGVVAYAALHAQSPAGQVPYRQWPAAVKGHFITRHPPLPDNEN
ncbi:DUF1636 family protein [Brevirhabdus sp.]|uniref:DUF1636 family protein n=1 Tax=Brevirhabdus sp. TaxID=2004514 RepID=UPI00405951A5